jgi:hypothetical protein
MSKFTYRPMSEYELALLCGLGAALSQLARLSDPRELLAELKEVREGRVWDTCTNGAATLDSFIYVIQMVRAEIVGSDD